MGQITPNMSIYVPAAGETNYDAPFLQGMLNVDQHNHTGGPDNGVPLGTAALQAGSVTYSILNANVVDTTTGLGISGSLPNQIVTTGILKSINALAPAGTGFLAQNGLVANDRTFQDTATIHWVNPDGVAGNPSANVQPDLTTVGAMTIASLTVTGALSAGSITTSTISSYQNLGLSVPASTTVPLNTLGNNQIWLYTAASTTDINFRATAMVYTFGTTIILATNLDTSGFVFVVNSGTNLIVNIQNTQISGRTANIVALRLL